MKTRKLPAALMLVLIALSIPWITSEQVSEFKQQQTKRRNVFIRRHLPIHIRPPPAVDW